MVEQRRPLAIGHVDEDDIGLRRAHREPFDASQALRQALRQRVVVGQALDMVVERVQRRRRQQAGLAQAATGHLAHAPRRRDQLAGAAQRRADRRAQPLAEADRQAVEVVGDLAQARQRPLPRRRAGDRRVEHARAVQVRGQTARARQRGGLGQIGLGHDMAVPGVFQTQQARTGEMRIIRLDRRRDVGDCHAPSRVLQQGLRLHAAEHGRTAAFIAVGMGQLADDVLVAAPAVRQDAAQIALRARGHEERGLLAGQLGDALLQRVDGRVVAEDIVAQRRCQHRLAHGRRRPGDGVAAQVDGRHAWSR